MDKILKALSEIQKKLKAPKDQFNVFGKYKYRNCEDILESVKPYLEDGLVLTLTDNIVPIGDRYYVEATATLILGDESISVKGFARESLDKKGMDYSQITGAASSYARKYALNGLFLIDDSKDADNFAPVKEEKIAYLTDDQVAKIDIRLLELNKDQDSFLRWCNSKDMKSIDASKFTIIKNKLGI